LLFVCEISTGLLVTTGRNVKYSRIAYVTQEAIGVEGLVSYLALPSFDKNHCDILFSREQQITTRLGGYLEK
jgi:hypothetical protein